MPLQPFVGPWPLLQYHNLLYTDGRTPWTGDQPVARPLPTRRATQTQNKQTHRHACLEWVSNPRSHVQASENSTCLGPRGHCDGHLLVISQHLAVINIIIIIIIKQTSGTLVRHAHYIDRATATCRRS
jgi:hypothetical protein